MHSLHSLVASRFSRPSHAHKTRSSKNYSSHVTTAAACRFVAFSLPLPLSLFRSFAISSNLRFFYLSFFISTLHTFSNGILFPSLQKARVANGVLYSMTNARYLPLGDRGEGVVSIPVFGYFTESGRVAIVFCRVTTE